MVIKMVNKKLENNAHTSTKSGKWIQHPLIKSDKIEARLYQQVLAADVIKNGNTMIVAPTALGKTIVAALVAAERLKAFENSKVLILAPSKPLVVQHEESFREFLKTSVSSLTGAIKPDDRVKRWNESQIICATPQTIESDIISSRYRLENVSLVVFDECHRGVGSYSYVYLATKYMKVAKNPLILGLTASPGWDESKIQEVCQNLYIKEVVIKKEEDSDVEPYFNPVEVKWVKTELNKELKDIKTHLEKALKVRLTTLKKMGVINSISNVSKKDVLKAKGMAQNRIGRSLHPPKKCFLAVSILTAVINIQHSIELLETQGTTTLQKYLERLKKKKTKAAKGLINDAEFQMAVGLTENAYKKGIDHPKLQKLMKILKNELADSNSRIIIFTQFRDSVENIYQHCVKEDINAVKFFGQASRESEKGLTQKKQKEIIKAFKNGEYDVLISTSVAEEGIDIPSVDLVVLYEPVPSEIRMIQRRGRTGRKNKGRMFILITKGTRDESYYWSSISKEKQMKKQLSQNYGEDLNNFKAPEILNHLEEDNVESEENRPVIYADSREGSSRVLRELERLNVDIKVKGLAVADYQVSDDVAIERKTNTDFVSSIMDKRLHKQAKELVDNFKKPVMIIEGTDFYSGFVHPNAVRGAIASIALDFGIPIIPTRSPEDTAAMINRIAIREQTHEKADIQIRTEKKPLTTWEQQLFIVESLPNIGPVTAKKLLDEFITVRGVINASEDELKKVEGIGDKIAKNILRVVNSGFKTIKTHKHLKLELKDNKEDIE
jgi:ERCC4-related helicase